MHFPLWLPRLLVESVLIVASILLALALDEWNEDRERQNLVNRSILVFEREIRQNMARVEAFSPIHQGLKNILSRREMEGGVASIAEFRDIVQGFEPEVLLDSAWETAIATGAMAHMSYDLVSAISLTYNYQKRFDSMYAAGRSDLLRANNVQSENLSTTAYVARRYMDDVTATENQLQAVYRQALELINDYKIAAELVEP